MARRGKTMTGYYIAAIAVTAAAAFATSVGMPGLANQQFDGDSNHFVIEPGDKFEVDMKTIDTGDLFVDQDLYEYPGYEPDPGLPYVGVGGG